MSPDVFCLVILVALFVTAAPFHPDFVLFLEPMIESKVSIFPSFFGVK